MEILRGHPSGDKIAADSEEDAAALTQKQIEEIKAQCAERAASAALSDARLAGIVAQAVQQTLIQLGVDTSDPLAMQRDFQHLRQWREAGEDLKRKGTIALLGIFFSGLASLILLGIKEWFHK